MLEVTHCLILHLLLKVEKAVTQLFNFVLQVGALCSLFLDVKLDHRLKVLKIIRLLLDLFVDKIEGFSQVSLLMLLYRQLDVLVDLDNDIIHFYSTDIAYTLARWIFLMNALHTCISSLLVLLFYLLYCIEHISRIVLAPPDLSGRFSQRLEA